MANSTRGAPLKNPWDRLKLKGKSYFVRGGTYASVYRLLWSYGKRHGKRFKVWTVSGGVNVRRIA